MEPSASDIRPIDSLDHAFFRSAASALRRGRVPFLVGGAFALRHYTGIARDTKDFDLFVRPGDALAALEELSDAGYRTEMLDPGWLGKAWSRDAFVDFIFGSGNRAVGVDDLWFRHATRGELFGLELDFIPPEEMIWSKSFVMERERFDGADVAHLIHARGEGFDWGRLLDRFGPNWRLLLAHLILFGYVYPNRRNVIPLSVMRELERRLARERPSTEDGRGPVCWGTLLSRRQYRVDVQRWGYRDARVVRGLMRPDEVEREHLEIPEHF